MSVVREPISARRALIGRFQQAPQASLPVGDYSGSMCGRFARKSTQEVLADWFGVEFEDMPWFAPTYNAAPQSVQPVVRLNRDSGSREFAQMRWGLVPFWAKDAKSGYSTINARAEEVASKPAYPRSPEEAPLPDPCRRLLRVAAHRQKDQAPLRHCPQVRHTIRHGRPLGALAVQGRRARPSSPSPSSPLTPMS